CTGGGRLGLSGELKGWANYFGLADDSTFRHGLVLVYVVRGLPGISKFKIVQESVEHTRVLLVVEEGFGPSNVERIRAGMAQRLGQVRIDIDMVADIPAEASGKYRHVVSKAVAT